MNNKILFITLLMFLASHEPFLVSTPKKHLTPEQLAARIREEDTLYIEITNGSWLDLLVDSDCRKDPGLPIQLSKGEQKEFPIVALTGGKTCKVYAIEETSRDNQRQAILCLDYAAEVGNCNSKNCICADAQCTKKFCPIIECKDGSCDNLGLKFVRGGDSQYGTSSDNKLHYGIINTKEDIKN